MIWSSATWREARAVYAGVDAVMVPEVFPFSTPRLTAMERIDGGKVTDVARLADRRAQPARRRIVKALIARPLWPDERPSLFHADPHAGNLMLTADGRVGLIDWSLVGRLSKRECVCLTQILIGALTIDDDRIVRRIAALGEGEGGGKRSARWSPTACAELRAGAWPGLDWLTALMDASATRGAVRYGANLIIFRKVLQTLQGVVADISDDVGVDVALAGAFAPASPASGRRG